LEHQFEFNGELLHAYPDVFYDVMPVETLNEMFDIDFESEHELIAISRGREIGALVYDVNWRLANYEKNWGSIAIPLYKRGYSPNTIYVYTSRFPLDELYTGEFHNYFSADIRYYGTGEWYYLSWHESDSSQKRNLWREFFEYLSIYVFSMPFGGTEHNLFE
jgi:hypothetical protein